MTTPSTLHQFLSSVPPPLTAALVGLSSPIAHLRWALEVITWKHSERWYDSWLVLFSWWAACLLFKPIIKYALPVVALLLYFWKRYAKPPVEPTSPSLTTEQHLQSTISDLTTIHALLPTSLPALLPLPPIFPSPTTIRSVLRLTLLLTLPYLFLTLLTPFPLLLALTGSYFLTYHAPWAQTLRSSLSRSAYVRWAYYHTYARLLGIKIPGDTGKLSVLRVLKGDEGGGEGPKKKVETPPIRFLFTLYENQRWWMGLDWTSALLPSERPSWSSPLPLLQPVSPPAIFSLPPDTQVYLHDNKVGRVKRTARWEWEEGEWRVLVRKDGSTGGGGGGQGVVSRVERPLPAPPGSESLSPSASRILKLATSQTSLPKQEVIELSEAEKRERRSLDCGGEEGEGEGGGLGGGEEDCVTDGDGWVYGDNKWEARSSKGGMGKYTRYRRWTRIAVLSETIEVVEPGETGVVKALQPDAPGTGDQISTQTQTDATTTKSTPASPPVAPTNLRPTSFPAPPSSSSLTSAAGPTSSGAGGSGEEEMGSLRQRLRAAVKRGSVSVGSGVVMG
ncbi:hypothetical protein JAAARDRAFT_35415 [Jaapia argillacea MUCL 33604]|uniref:Peroxin/Ferlin domain-containing protein n=1 Tax=Jaapia argillacea MUCL 33604 TaxID=933084 RepID=A0A067PSK8_9AGAM|nr:hypothetical protein JAAARDRAFT_35415 [Jaapia argillacea MUCL 33604]